MKEAFSGELKEPEQHDKQLNFQFEDRPSIPESHEKHPEKGFW